MAGQWIYLLQQLKRILILRHDLLQSHVPSFPTYKHQQPLLSFSFLKYNILPKANPSTCFINSISPILPPQIIQSLFFSILLPCINKTALSWPQISFIQLLYFTPSSAFQKTRLHMLFPFLYLFILNSLLPDFSPATSLNLLQVHWSSYSCTIQSKFWYCYPAGLYAASDIVDHFLLEASYLLGFFILNSLFFLLLF